VDRTVMNFLKCRSGDSLMLIYCSDTKESDIIRTSLTKLPRGVKLTAILDVFSDLTSFDLTYGLECREKNTSSDDLLIGEKSVQADVICFTRRNNSVKSGKLLSSLRNVLQNNNYEITLPSLLSQIEESTRIWFSRIKILDVLFDFIK